LSDLEKVTKQAKAMVTIYGLNDKVGNLTYYDSSGQSEYNFTKPYSEKTSELIDKEISKIIEAQYQRALSLLKDNKDKLDKLAELLFEKEVIFKDDMEDIFGKRPFKKPEMIKPNGYKVGGDASKSEQKSTPPEAKENLNGEDRASDAKQETEKETADKKAND